ncbi:60S acidic ribosomal protein P2 [Tritrichomonas musculus]|uniref:60S acidic ribosomal protein P2 n=1 Tax=Tritrichomonas musculus TaxID=1915356 RepID=A0ABR2KBU2_9EUKA
MKYIAAYLLAQLGGDENPGKDKIKKILESVGIAPEDQTIDALLGKLQGKNITELIAEGSSKLAVVGGGSAGGAAAAPAQGAAATEEKKEEKKEEEEVEMAGGFDDLFG